MDRNQLIKKIVEAISADDSLLKSIGELTLDMKDVRIAEEQKPNTMYVLCAKVTVKTDEEEPLFHYHPVIKNCLLNPDAECNEMVAASDLIELQKIKAQFEVQIYSVEYVILAVPFEVYKELQGLLDETIAEIICNVRHAAESFMKSEKLAAAYMLDFDSIYRTILSQMAIMTKTVIGSALDSKSNIIKEINDVEYDMPEPPPDSCVDDDDDECDGDCINCEHLTCSCGFGEDID